MAKYAVTYEEVYQKTFIIEADSPEEAEEKMEYAAENISLDMDDAFDHWNIGTAKKANCTCGEDGEFCIGCDYDFAEEK